MDFPVLPFFLSNGSLVAPVPFPLGDSPVVIGTR